MELQQNVNYVRNFTILILCFTLMLRINSTRSLAEYLYTKEVYENLRKKILAHDFILFRIFFLYMF
jgi:hypothetical protein